MVKQVKPDGVIEDTTAKHIFDRIGKIVYETVEKDALPYENELHGLLTNATFEKNPPGKQTPARPCKLNHEYHTNATNGRSYPCRKGTEKRFSEVSGGECDKNKIRGSKGDNEGACAPYRRLNLCVRNLENISDFNNINNDTLLADVCLAALHEGDSIRSDHYKYKLTNSSSQICTMLARSFADIGDIIRGKDLYLGDNGKDRLEENLRKIFKKIYDNLVEKKKEAKDYYKDTTNYYKLREDWWNNNRKMVWYAITCGAAGGEYFRKTCGTGTPTNKQCRCTTRVVPTYFDYVPQYLRWFDEWAEEFCRLRKHKLQNAIKNCRYDENNKERYCDLNGYNCKETIRGKDILVEGEGCKKCTVPCDNFVHWIDNQQKEFLKQKNKYAEEIKKADGKNGTSNGKINNTYEKEFYTELKKNYQDVDKFLDILSKEQICQSQPKVGNEIADAADFTKDKTEETFSHTEYCQACPWCGVKDGGPPWEAKGDGECKKTRENPTYKSTEIPILTGDKTKSDMVQKYNKFCKNNGGNDATGATPTAKDGENGKKGNQIETWKCYYDESKESGQNNNCILGDWQKVTQKDKIMPYHPFFWKWVTEMLIDSMYWRKELKSCINNNKNTCRKGCHDKCECYKRWVKQKKEEEWKQMEKHFKTQDFGSPVGLLGQFGYDAVLQQVLDIQDLFENIKDTYGNVKELEGIKKMLEKEKSQEVVGAVTENKNTIDLLFEDEEKEAEKCKDCPLPEDKSPGRALNQRPDEPTASDDGHDDVHDNEIHQRDLNIEDDVEEEEGSSEDTNGATEATTTQDGVKPACDIVADIFSNVDTLKQACSTKYVNGREKFPNWKCVPTSDKSDASGSICVPPRRRKLYIHDLQSLSGEDGKTQSHKQLLEWFVKSAAVETFFLWDRYKKENKPQNTSQLQTLDGSSGDDEDDPQNKLKSGTIPSEFLRQMFYTFGDYRDIVVRGGGDVNSGSEKEGGGSSSNEKNLVVLLSENKQEMEKIQQEIDKILKQSGSKLPGVPPKPSVENPRVKWWDTNAQHIWNGMICALTYKDSGDKKIEQVKTANGDDLFQELKNGNDYDKVSFGGTEGPINTNAGKDAHKGTKLKDFVNRPTYFRWLEEWGEEFYRKRTHKLTKAKNKCQGYNANYNRIYCSGDGYDCTDNDLKYNNIYAALNCRHCHKQCRNYKIWIKNKEKEFDNQKKKYEMEIPKLKANSINNGQDEKFYNYIKNYSTVDKFLASLNQAKEYEDNIDQENKIDFNNNRKTFGPSTYCKACPLNGVTCKSNGKCEENKEKVQNNAKGEPTDIHMFVDDKSTNVIEKKLQGKCKEYGLYKDLANQVWTCQKKQDAVDYCIIKDFVKSEYYDEKIPFNILFHRWLIDFIQYYNKSKETITRCIKDVNSCKEGCKDNCDCVDQWINKKCSEWEIIKKYFKAYLQTNEERIAYTIKTFFQQGLFENDYKKAEEVLDDKNQKEIEKLWGCTGGITCNTDDEEQLHGDFITNLIKKLKEKIESCQKKHTETSGNPSPPCVDTPPLVEEEINPLDEDTTDIQKPLFCPTEEDDGQESEEEEEVCEMVKTLLDKSNGGTSGINDCNPKDHPNKDSYPKWDCTTSKIKTGEEGACMPPRRQKLCINDLKVLKDQSDANKQDLKKAFIKCAAIETYFSWHYYKSKKRGVDTQKQLKEEKIPDEFKKIMYYTFADYKDICLGKDISSDQNIQDISKKVNDILNGTNRKSGSTECTPETWWEKYGHEIWEGMLCALTHEIDAEEKKNKIKTTYKDPPHDFAKNPQFLRWFIEWGDQFCRERVVKIEELKNGCNDYKCENTDEDKKQACKTACEDYKKWLKDWKDQYEQQTAKFDKDKKAGKFDGTSAEEDVDVSSVHEYLQEQLEKLCKNSDCACMKNPSTKDEETELLGENYFPEAMDYPPKEINKKCDCAIPPEPMSCVEQIAKHLREKAEKNVKNYESSLKGKPGNFNNNCNQIDEAIKGDNGSRTINKNKLNTTFPSNGESCENVGTDRLKIGQEWKCDKINNTEENICFPPRRQHICLKKLENMKNSVIDNNEKLLKAVMEAAQYEAIDILKKMKPEKEIKFCEICDAMKYSFADIGDIIRGKSKIKTNNGDNIEDKLKEIFTKLKSGNSSLNNMELTQFREKWWDANRKDVWNAMTCVAPNDAHLKKKTLNNSGHNSHTTDSIRGTQEKCGYDKEPPDYDYIPERYRFLQEWSEYYCKALKEKNDEMKNKCSECLRNGTCENDKNDNTCEECKKKCEDYTKFVDKWKAQFEEQNEIYKTLYIQDRTHGPNAARRNPSIKFLKKLEESCDNPYSAEKYLDKSTHCTDYKFSETNNNENDAFSPYPNDYKEQCKCKEKSENNASPGDTRSLPPEWFLPKIPGIKTIQNVVPRIPNRIKNIMPDAHTIHAIVARSFDYFVPKFPKEFKPPPTNNILNEVLPSAIPVGIALALTSIAFLYLKKKTKASVGNLFQILQIPKSDYDIPTLESKNRYIPYKSGPYKGKTYIYMEGDSDSGHYYEDTTDVTSSESEYEELDINDIYVPGSPKYKTLIEVVLEPSGNNTTASGNNTTASGNNTTASGNNTTASGKNTPSDTQNDIQNDGIPSSKITDNEWNTLKDEFISQYLQSEQPKDVPNDYRSGTIPTNTNNTTMPRHNVEEKPFITSIHDRNLYTGEEINYNINMSTNSANNDLYSGQNNLYSDVDSTSGNRDSYSDKNDPISDNHHPYSGIDLINDSLNSGNQPIDIYDELLKRKENELFGTEHHPKRTTTNHFATPTRDDPLHNQLELFHKWLDRHRDMCEKWENHHERLAKLKEEWENETHSGNTHPSDSNKTLNTDVSIQIHMDNPKPINQFTNMDTYPNNSSMDTILEDLDKPFNEPYYYDMYDDDIYYDVNDDNDTSTADSNAMDVSNKVQIEMDVNTKLVKKKYPIADVWDI
ncbi:variant surface protein [Plasmodium falciparum RAJ116]|uniref:Variant surface protein n=2 Tax=Plasmodium falciparum TaxID=5833 RepID=A0A0L0CRS1_PLAFA|nr:variant surface protein [Plasmodium falciparum RAJ116]